MRKPTPESEARKAECIRLHTQLDYGCTAISLRTGTGKGLVVKWLKKAGVYKTGHRARKPIKTLSASVKCLVGKMVRYSCVENNLSIAWRPFKTKRKRITRKQSKEYLKMRYERWKKDTNKKIKWQCRNRIKQALKAKGLHQPCRQRGWKRTIDLVGCTMPELKAHIERQFKPGMGWHNNTQHGWHIDHIVPISLFDLSDPIQLRKATHYSNLQPMWAADNLKKGNRV